MEDEFNFDKDFTGLYYILDSLSNVRISKFLEFPTVAHACISFSQFIDHQLNDKIANVECFKLYFACSVDSESNILSKGKVFVCDGSNVKEKMDFYISKYKLLNEVK